MAKRQWKHKGPTPEQKNLAAEIQEIDPRFKPITKQEWARWDRMWWLYQDKYPWWSAAYTGTRRYLVRTPAVKTAAIGWLRGEAVFVANPDYLFGNADKNKPPLNPGQQFFILHHEMEHLIRNHVQVMADWPNKQRILNFCMDAIINEGIRRDEIRDAKSCPPGLIWKHDIAEAANMYVADPSHAPKKEWPDPDTDEFVNKFISEELLLYLPTGTDDSHEKGIRYIIDKLPDGDMFDDGSTDQEQKKDIMERMIEEAEKSCGAGPGRLQSFIGEVKDKSNRDWTALMRQPGSSQNIIHRPSWMKYNKRKPGIAPGKLYHPQPEGIAMLDTSASMGADELGGAFLELNRLSDLLSLAMAFVDDVWDKNDSRMFIPPGDIKPGKAYKHAPFGGGGTRFKEFFEYMLDEGKKKYEFCLIITDGFTCDNPLVPGKMARWNYAIMTPNHNQNWAQQALAHGWSVAVMGEPASEYKLYGEESYGERDEF